MKRSGWTFLAICFLLIGLFCCPVKAHALSQISGNEITLEEMAGVENAGGAISLVSESDGIYTYCFSDYGNFRTNVQSDSVGIDVYFEFDETLDFDLMCGEQLCNYTPGDTLNQNGEYTLFLYPQDDNIEAFSQFTFRIENGVDADISTNDQGMTVKETKVKLESGVDYEKGCLTYSMNGEVVLWTTVPNQGIAVDGIVLNTADGITLTIERNSKSVSRSEDFTYTDPGSYRCTLSDYRVSMETGIQTYIGEYDFTLISKETNLISVLNSPNGYHIQNASCQDKEIDIDSNTMWLERDGKYSITFLSDEIEGLTYSIEFTRDTIAPFLTFDTNIYKKMVNPPVSFSTSDDYSNISIYEKNLLLTLSEYKLAKPGNYSITISDSAGNTRDYTIFVNNVFKFVTVRSIITLIVIVIIITVWIIITRKKQYRVL